MQQFIPCKSYNTARKQAPWAFRIVRVEGGFMAFEFATDYYTWKAQK
jgi:hypothetical protein